MAHRKLYHPLLLLLHQLHQLQSQHLHHQGQSCRQLLRLHQARAVILTIRTMQCASRKWSGLTLMGEISHGLRMLTVA